jgi:hypothetical protein
MLSSLRGEGLIALGLSAQQYRQLGALREAAGVLATDLDALRYDRWEDACGATGFSHEFGGWGWGLGVARRGGGRHGVLGGRGWRQVLLCVYVCRGGGWPGRGGSRCFMDMSLQQCLAVGSREDHILASTANLLL